MTAIAVIPAEVLLTLRERCYQLRGQIRQMDLLSRPCPPGKWRWADVKNDGFSRKSAAELAADREKSRQQAADLRRRLAEIEAYLAQLGVSPS